MATVEMVVKKGQKLTEEQYAQLQQACAMPIVYDEDSPETTLELYEEYEPLAAEQREKRENPVIFFPVKKETLERAKALGAGYTEILGELLELALNDSEMIKKCIT